METTTGRAQESGHWYMADGRPAYEIRGANGLMRPVTLRDARKYGWLPGVSSILQMEAKPQLERWKIEQAVMASLTLPRLKDETDDSFVPRVLEDSREQARKAAERGTLIHAAIQSSFEGAPVEAEYIPYVEAVRAWLAQRYGVDGWQAETSFGCEHGYGGKTDLIHRGIPCLLDFKGKDFDASAKAKDMAWPENVMQLAAYREGQRLPRADCANVFFSRTVPGLICVREWDQDEIAEGWEAFQCLLRLWQIRKNYRPQLVKAAA